MPVIPYSIRRDTTKMIKRANKRLVGRVQLDESLVLFFLWLFLCKLCSAAMLRCTNRFSSGILHFMVWENWAFYKYLKAE